MSTEILPTVGEEPLNLGQDDQARAAVFQDEDLPKSSEELAEAHCRRCGSPHREILDQDFVLRTSAPENQKDWRP